MLLRLLRFWEIIKLLKTETEFMSSLTVQSPPEKKKKETNKLKYKIKLTREDCHEGFGHLAGHQGVR